MSTMQAYRNLGGHSGIECFALADEEIIVRFRRGAHREYGYNRQSLGDVRLAEMKRLALQGRGLNSYILEHARERYAWRA
ncbi:MAG: hypothetical protein Q4G62_07570 [Pseudomonadota bacterium]|nr:hypothetical protein [Pseudomonadota bacterium]